ncbi:MAG: class I SAM-dependent methyltransferase [Verrucomicrobiales bacterium]|nr:class I SAM-dependent methyltransferase [Verrucomicrobiales bacterium]
MNKKLYQAAKNIQSRVFLGGSISQFENGGRNQFIQLLKRGLNPDSSLLDLGCGCLRGGYWTIQFLNPDCYAGIEPNREMLACGKKEIVGQDIINKKRPVFDHNDRFNMSVFSGRSFDFVMAGSIWTHSPKWMINKMLQQFVKCKTPDGIMLASFIRTHRADRDYTGKNWVGKSHRSNHPGLVMHRLESLQEIADSYRLSITHPTPDRIESPSWAVISAK